MSHIAEKKTFRDSLATVKDDGRRNWIYPHKPKGKYFNKRALVSYILLIILFGTPFLKIDGRPFLLLDILNRKFIIFGFAFWPQDFYILVISLLIIILTIAVFTSVFGRLWCGWTCPQTIFMEMVFRRIEFWIEGDAPKQKRLNASSLTVQKFFKKALKHGIFFSLSFLIANTLLAYIIGVDELFKIIYEPISMHTSGLVAISIFTSLFYGVFASFREQACTIVCPYGRFQSVLVNDDTIAVSYDYVRGEPRGKMKKGSDEQNQGDCVACNRCVQVCPTGIDIRNGIQLECVNCTACIDVCDDVMIKIKREPGLIRYASESSIKNRIPFKLSARQFAYTIIQFLLIVVLTVLLMNRKDVEAFVLRDPGVLFQKIDESHYSNLYKVTFINKTFEEHDPSISLKDIRGDIRYITPKAHIVAQESRDFRFMIIIDKADLKPLKNEIEIEIKLGEQIIKVIKTSFVAPEKGKL